MNVAIFLIYIVESLWVGVALKKHLEKASIAMIGSYFVCFAMRMANWLFNLIINNKDLLSYFLFPDMVASFVISMLCYNLAFEMRNVKDKLESQDYKEYKQRQKVTNILRAIVFSLYFLTFACVLGIYVKMDTETKIDFTCYISLLITRIIKFTFITLGMAIFFLKHLVYFVQRKRKVSPNKQLKCLEFAMLLWILFLLLLFIFSQSLYVTFGSLIFSQSDDYDLVKNFYEYGRYILTPVIDFLIASTINYLFYVQGKMAIDA